MNVRRVATWTIGVLLVLAMAGFLAFLYLIPPFDLVSPESLIAPETAAPPSLASITDPKTRALAERGKYIVMITGCVDCHAPPGPNGPDFSRYMGGGLKTSFKGHGTFVSGLIAGNGASSGGAYVGEAPGANLVSIKVAPRALTARTMS